VSEGIRALMTLAVETQQPLPFGVAIVAGGTLVSGAIAPWWLMHDVTTSAAQAQVEEAVKRVRDLDERGRIVEQYVGPLRNAFTNTREREEQQVQDEVTLYDAAIYPAVGDSGMQRGGVSLPVVRVPLASIDAWWVTQGRAIPGSGGFGMGVGFMLPIGN
jgi:hypothetical protein